MVKEEKLQKVCSEFSLLNEEQQDYILGILQALVFAKNSSGSDESAKSEASSGVNHS